MLGISSVSAILLAAAIGSIAGFAGGIGGQIVEARLRQRNRPNALKLDSLLLVQNSLTDLNRLHYLVSSYLKRNRLDLIPDGLLAKFTNARGRLYSHSQRLVDNSLRENIDGLRQTYSQQLYVEYVEGERRRIDKMFTNAQDQLGKEIRRRIEPPTPWERFSRIVPRGPHRSSTREGFGGGG